MFVSNFFTSLHFFKFWYTAAVAPEELDTEKESQAVMEEMLTFTWHKWINYK